MHRVLISIVFGMEVTYLPTGHCFLGAPCAKPNDLDKHVCVYIYIHTHTPVQQFIRTYIQGYMHAFTRAQIQTNAHTQMDGCIYTHMRRFYIYIYMYTHTHTYIYIYICMYVPMCVCMYVCMYVEIQIYDYMQKTYAHAYVYICMYVCMYVYKCIHIYICTSVYVCVYVYVSFLCQCDPGSGIYGPRATMSKTAISRRQPQASVESIVLMPLTRKGFLLKGCIRLPKRV